MGPKGYHSALESRLSWFMRTIDERGDGCWVRRSPVSPGDYARVTLSDNGKQYHVQLHRWMYEELAGPIPEGKVLDHLCKNRVCVNPAHLEPVTLRENILRGNSLTARNARKTHCPRGHSYDEKNTYINPKGSRMCRRCGADKMHRQRHPELYT